MTSLPDSLSLFADCIDECVKNNRQIMVVTHMDCDGLTSGAIIAKALIRAGVTCSLRSIPEFSAEVITEIGHDNREFCVITDLGGGFAKDLDAGLGEKWIVLDHHRIPDSEHDHQRVINAWRYGIDGGMEVCAGGMAYLAAVALDRNNADLSPMAVVAALGDRQDQGDKRSLIGKNLEISDTAKSMGLLEVDLDLLLYGRETRPVAYALAYTSQPYIKGITWERGNCAALLMGANIPLKDNGRWRTVADLSQEEKSLIINAIAEYAPGKGVTEAMSELVGHTYTLTGEEKGGLLRDCREFGTMLNSCGRMGKAGVGMAVCMGDRGVSLSEAEEAIKRYRRRIREYMNIISSERWRTTVRKSSVLVDAEGVVAETMTGTIASLMAGSPSYAGKMIILWTGGAGNTIKFSGRKARGCPDTPRLDDIMSRGAQRCEGIGGGHDMAAGARIGKDKLDEFLDFIEADVNDV